MTAVTIPVPVAAAVARTALNSAAWVSLRSVRLVVWVMVIPLAPDAPGTGLSRGACLAGERLSGLAGVAGKEALSSSSRTVPGVPVAGVGLAWGSFRWAG